MKQYSKAAFAAILVFSLTLVADYSGRTFTDPPAARFRQWADSFPITNIEFYCGRSERFFDRYPSRQRVKNIVHARGLAHGIDTSWPEPSARYVCDDIPGFKPPKGEPEATFPSRKGDPVDKTLRIYKLEF